MTRILRRAAGLLLVAPALALLPSPAHAVASCVVTGTAPSQTLTVTAGADDQAVSLRAEDGIVKNTWDNACTDGEAFIALANLDHIVLQHTADPSGSFSWMLDLASLTGVDFVFHNRSTDSLILEGTAGNDSWTAVDGADQGLSLDAGATPDIAVDGPFASGQLSTHGGDDSVTLSAGTFSLFDAADNEDEWSFKVQVFLGGGDDTATGTPGPERIDGQEGGDTIGTLAGADFSDAGPGHDEVDLGAGNDRAGVWSDDDTDLIQGGADRDSVWINTSGEARSFFTANVDGDDGVAGENDDWREFEVAESSVNSGGVTVTAADTGTEFRAGAFAKDVLLSGPGDDVFIGDVATDEVSYVRDTSPGDADGVFMFQMGMGEPYTVFGHGNDILNGVASIIGTPKADVFDLGQASFARVRPGLGDDDLWLGNSGVMIQESIPDGADELQCSSGCAWDYGLRTTPVSVTLDGIADDGAPGEGDKVFAGSDVFGGLGGDVLVGTGEPDVLVGNGGNDEVYGRGGIDNLIGSDGADTLSGGAGGDIMDGGAGADRIFGNAGEDTISGEGDNDVLDGGLGDDDESGGSGSDTFVQGSTSSENGSDVLDGGDGLDTATYLGRTAGVVASNNGSFGDGNAGEGDNVRANIEKLVGTNAADVITGAGLGDLLYGYGGNDTVRGGSGNDTLDGGTGADKLYGDSGNDRFYAKDSTKDTVSGGTGTDKARRDTTDVVSSIEGTF